jgi:hypothetical protein
MKPNLKLEITNELQIEFWLDPLASLGTRVPSSLVKGKKKKHDRWPCSEGQVLIVADIGPWIP